jgi:hypothetical protein
MNPYLSLVGILVVGFVVYYFARDSIFEGANRIENAIMEQLPSEQFIEHASIEVRQALSYPPRNVAPSGPNSPNQEPPSREEIVHGDPAAKDPYHESNESSDIPENLRHPERSFRPPPLNDNTDISIQSGISSRQNQDTSANTQQYQQEFIQGGGEFMPGIFANDTFDDTNFSAF